MKKFNFWLTLSEQAIIWTNADPIHWRIYAALGGDEFRSYFTEPLTIQVVVNEKIRMGISILIFK